MKNDMNFPIKLKSIKKKKIFELKKNQKHDIDIEN